MLGLCACGPARPEHDKDIQNSRGITKIEEARAALNAAAKDENRAQARMLEGRARAREKQARVWFEKAAAEANHTVKGSDTGVSIAGYYGIRQDLIKTANPALDWNNLKVGQTVTIPGHPGAQFNLGMLYEKERQAIEAPLEKKKQKPSPAQKKAMQVRADSALLWFLKSAEQDFTNAEFMMGRYHALGWGVKRNPRKAIEWYERAARKGHAAALNNLGAVYYKGDGVERDLVQAYKWYALAAQQSGKGQRKESRGQAHKEIRDNKDPTMWRAAVKQVLAREKPDKKNVSATEADVLLEKIVNGQQLALQAYLKLRTDDLMEKVANSDDASKAKEAISRNFLNARELSRAKQLVADYIFEIDPFAK